MGFPLTINQLQFQAQYNRIPTCHFRKTRTIPIKECPVTVEVFPESTESALTWSINNGEPNYLDLEDIREIPEIHAFRINLEYRQMKVPFHRQDLDGPFQYRCSCQVSHSPRESIHQDYASGNFDKKVLIFVNDSVV